jgi:hypothetical protein
MFIAIVAIKPCRSYKASQKNRPGILNNNVSSLESSTALHVTDWELCPHLVADKCFHLGADFMRMRRTVVYMTAPNVPSSCLGYNIYVL